MEWGFQVMLGYFELEENEFREKPISDAWMAGSGGERQQQRREGRVEEPFLSVLLDGGGRLLSEHLFVMFQSSSL